MKIYVSYRNAFFPLSNRKITKSYKDKKLLGSEIKTEERNWVKNIYIYINRNSNSDIYKRECSARMFGPTVRDDRWEFHAPKVSS